MSVHLTGKLFSKPSPNAALTRAARTTRNIILHRTRERSRVLTGLMRRSWVGTVKSDRHGVSIELKNDVHYTKYQEFGTSRIKPSLAASQSMAEAPAIFLAQVQKELRIDLDEAVGNAAVYIVEGLTNSIRR
jgi:uncharacterized membrane protein YkoI